MNKAIMTLQRGFEELAHRYLSKYDGSITWEYHKTIMSKGAGSSFAISPRDPHYAIPEENKFNQIIYHFRDDGITAPERGEESEKPYGELDNIVILMDDFMKEEGLTPEKIRSNTVKYTLQE